MTADVIPWSLAANLLRDLDDDLAASSTALRSGLDQLQAYARNHLALFTVDVTDEADLFRVLASFDLVSSIVTAGETNGVIEYVVASEMRSVLRCVAAALAPYAPAEARTEGTTPQRQEPHR